MSNTPGEFYDIGKKARDLLHKDYTDQPRAPINFDYRSLKSNTSISCRVKDVVPEVPEVSALFSFYMPDSGKVEYLNGLAGISGGVRLIRNNSLGRYDPVANLSGRGALFSFGTDLAFDTATGTFNKIHAGLNLNSDFVNASLSLDRLDSLKASCHYMVNPLTKTAIAAELKHKFSIDDTAFVLGAQHAIAPSTLTKTAIAAELKHKFSIDDTAFVLGARHAIAPSTLAKGRISTDGKVGALIRQGLWERIFLSMSGEVDFTAAEPSATLKIGLSLAARLQMNVV